MMSKFYNQNLNFKQTLLPYQELSATVQMHHQQKHYHNYYLQFQQQSKYDPLQKPKEIFNKSEDSEKSFDSYSMMSYNVGNSSCDKNCNHSVVLLDGANHEELGPLIENEEELSDDEKEKREKELKPSPFNLSWTFPRDFIINRTPSRNDGISYNDEIKYRRIGTTFIRDLTQLIKMKPICRETAYVYFHRFYMLRSFQQFEPIRIAMACLYFAGKYEDHPLCKDHLIQVSYMMINNKKEQLDKDTQQYIEYCNRLILDENYLLQVLGFELSVHHFQVLVVNCYSKHQITGSMKELYKAAYQIASELNRLTTLCLEYSAPILASVSIYLAARFKTIPLPDDWCQSLIPNSGDHCYTKKLVIKISEQYRDIWIASKVINRLCSEEYKTNNYHEMRNKSDNEPKLSLSNNLSPDSAYSSSSSNNAAYSPVAESIVSNNKLTTICYQSKAIQSGQFVKMERMIPFTKEPHTSQHQAPLSLQKNHHKFRNNQDVQPNTVSNLTYSRISNHNNQNHSVFNIHNDNSFILGSNHPNAHQSQSLIYDNNDYNNKKFKTTHHQYSEDFHQQESRNEHEFFQTHLMYHKRSFNSDTI